MIADPQAGIYDGIVLAVTDTQFIEMGRHVIRTLGTPGHLLYDFECVLPKDASDLRL